MTRRRNDLNSITNFQPFPRKKGYSESSKVVFRCDTYTNGKKICKANRGYLEILLPFSSNLLAFVVTPLSTTESLIGRTTLHLGPILLQQPNFLAHLTSRFSLPCFLSSLMTVMSLLSDLRCLFFPCLFSIYVWLGLPTMLFSYSLFFPPSLFRPRYIFISFYMHNFWWKRWWCET